MTQSPALNPEHVQVLCSRLGLGNPAGHATRVYGGFHHKMWRIDAGRCAYAVKQLSADADLRDPGTVHHYNVSEQIAETFARHGIAAVAALRGEAGYVQLVGGAGYLVYPWSDAVALDRRQIDEHHGLKIARLLAAMHRADIDVPGVRSTQYAMCPAESIHELVRRAGDCHVLCAKALSEHLQSFIEIGAAYAAATELLQSHLVIGHGDMDQKNVLWDAMQRPLVIDWESARKLNPTYELVYVALDWSGIASTFDPSLFEKFVSAYRRAGGVIESDVLEAALQCILGDWLIWLLYIVALSLDEADPEQRAIEAEQIDFVLPTIVRLKRLAPELLSTTFGVAAC